MMTKLNFTDQEVQENLHKIELDDIIFTCSYIEIDDNNSKIFTLQGTALMEGETYNEFTIEVELEKELREISCEAIINSNWYEYDLIF